MLPTQQGLLSSTVVYPTYICAIVSEGREKKMIVERAERRKVVLITVCAGPGQIGLYEHEELII